MNFEEYENNRLKTLPERIDWWLDARFGMFIHVGLYSVKADHEWSKGNQNIKREEYNQLANWFNITEGAIESWVKLAYKTGMKYVVLTTRHHEGFSLWKSNVNEFNSTNFGSRIDVVKYFVKYCRKYGLRIGLYFSLMDWNHDDAYSCMIDEDANKRFTDYIKGMLRELMTNYGKIDVLWYDIPRPMIDAKGWDSIAMNEMVRQLQPQIIINNRSRLAEDFITPEERIGGSQDVYWESCMTLNRLSWGYINEKQIQPYLMTPQQVIRTLIEIISKKGNLLLNVNPDANGKIPNSIISILNSVGQWLDIYGEVVYGRNTPTKIHRANDLCISIERENIAYIVNFIRPLDGLLRLGGEFSTVKEVVDLYTSNPLVFNQSSEGIDITLNEEFSSELGIGVVKLIFKDTIEFKRATLYPQINVGRFI